MRALLAILAVVPVGPLKAQTVPEGDEVRVREGKGAPWFDGVYAGSDSASMVLTQDGIERVYELLEIERVEWKAPKNFLPEFLLLTGLGALTGLSIESLRLINCFGESQACNENWGTAAAIGAVSGAGLYSLGYLIWPGRWKNVTKHYPPAGTQQD